MAELEYKDIITVDVLLNSASFVATDFTKVIYLVPLATNSLAGASPTAFGAHGSKYVSVSSPGAASTANLDTSGSFSATSINALTAFFRQRPIPSSITVIAVDLVGGDAYDDVIADYLATGNDFQYVLKQERTAAVTVAVADALAALTDRKRFLVAQCNDSTIKAASGTYAAGTLGSAWTTKEYCIGLLAPDAQFDDMRYCGQISTFRYLFDNCPCGDLVFIGAEAKTYTDPEKEYALANFWNLNAKFGRSNITNEGVFADGTDVYTYISIVTFADALKVALSNLKVKYSSRKQKLPMDSDGRKLITSTCLPIITDFIAKQHFDKEEPYSVVVPDFSDELKANKNIPVYITATTLHSATKVGVKVYVN